MVHQLLKRQRRWLASARLSVISSGLTLIAYSASAEQIQDNLNTFAGEKGAGFTVKNTKPLPELIGFYLQILLTFLGVIFLILAIYAGYLWLTAGGNEEQVTKAKDYLRNAIIGLIIIAGAYAINAFVLSKITI